MPGMRMSRSRHPGGVERQALRNSSADPQAAVCQPRQESMKADFGIVINDSDEHRSLEIFECFEAGAVSLLLVGHDA